MAATAVAKGPLQALGLGASLAVTITRELVGLGRAVSYGLHAARIYARLPLGGTCCLPRMPYNLIKPEITLNTSHLAVLAVSQPRCAKQV